MSLSSAARLGCWTLVVVLGAAATARAADVPSKSEGPAKALAKLLEERKMDSAAARDPENKNQFIAVLYYPGMLLLIAAPYAAPQIMEQSLAQKNYQDVYRDLNSATDPKTRFFVQDLSADGLHALRDEGHPVDSVDAPAVKMAFDGEWKKKKVSEEEYMKAFATADAAYSRFLTILLDSLRKGS